jgi:hypothetical protein
MYSYPLDKALTDPHIPMAFTNGLHACAIWSYIIPDDQTVNFTFTAKCH